MLETEGCRGLGFSVFLLLPCKGYGLRVLELIGFRVK